MIIWQGLGVLVAVITFAILIAVELITESSMNDPSYYQAHGWPKLVALWISAILVYFLARYFDSRPGHVVIDKASGQEIELKSGHSLFFIPVRYWPYILAVLGVVFLFVVEN